MELMVFGATDGASRRVIEEALTVGHELIEVFRDSFGRAVRPGNSPHDIRHPEPMTIFTTGRRGVFVHSWKWEQLKEV